MSKDKETQEAMKEALHEWLESKYAEVGHWTVKGLVATALSVLVYLILHYGVEL